MKTLSELSAESKSYLKENRSERHQNQQKAGKPFEQA